MTKTNPNPPAHRAAQFSLLSIWLTAVAITINHLFALGPKAFGLGAVLVIVPTLSLFWFSKSKSRVALALYMLMNAWIILGFGLLKGFWDSFLRVFVGSLLSSVSTSFPKPVIGNALFELSGLLMFIGSGFVLYTLVRFIRARQQEVDGAKKPRFAIMRLTITTPIVVLLLATAGYVWQAQDRWVAPKNNVVKIGVIAPTTGPYAILGGSFVKAVQMAQSDANAKNPKYRYELVIRDSGSDPAKAKAIIRDIIQKDKVDAVLGGVSLIGQVTKPQATQARIPHLCVCTVTTIGDGAYNFTNIPSPEAEAVLWVQEAQRRGINSVSLITQDYPSINNHVKALKDEAAKKGLRIVSERTFANENVTDFSAAIAEAQAQHPDVYYVEALNPALDTLAKQLNDTDIHNLSAVVAPSLSEKQSLFEGAWYTDSNLVDFDFKKRFEAKYPNTEFATHMMPYAYDNFNMIVQAYEHGQNPAVYIRNLTSYEGTAGHITKAKGSGNFASVPAVWEIKNGKPALMGKE
jgi:ABC-type branched-subunit amino acid transport system substrate-binding protein